MWIACITIIAVVSVTTLYLWEGYRWRLDRGESDQEAAATIAPKPVEGSDWESEYLLTADYGRE